VIGAAVIDEIIPFGGASGGADARPRPVRSLGGIFYSLSALAALAPAPSQVVPALRVGADAAALIRSAVAALGLDLRFVRATPARQNRVRLRYTSSERRIEVLRGGVPSLSTRELGPFLREIDALYVNFVAGNELRFPALRSLRRSFRGPLYADLHSLLLGRRRSGTRFPRPLPGWRDWVACCDAIQCNLDEAALLCGLPAGGARPRGAEVERLAREILRLGPSLLVVTDGPRPVRAWEARAGRLRLVPPRVRRSADPTGCGDVLGAAFCALRFLEGLSVRRALRRAVGAASRAAARLGTGDLAADLQRWYRERPS
jgi:sugar/nucleoside kinase (ribokinase family)